MGIVLLSGKWGVQCAPDTKEGQGLDFPAPMRCELSPVSPTQKKYRGTRKPAWIGLVPCVPCVPYSKNSLPKSCCIGCGGFCYRVTRFLLGDQPPLVGSFHHFPTRG